MMMENYRSTPEILAACNSLIAKNANRIKKDLLPMLPGGAPVLCHHAANSEQESRWIAAQIKTLHEAGTPYRDMAVLYRAHYITRGVEEILLKEKIPYTIYSGVQFFARAEIKDALSYLRMIACRDDLSFLRIANVPKRNLGERRMTFLKDYAAQNGCSLYDALRKNLDGELLRGTKAGKFVSLIERFTGVYDQMPVSELLAAVLEHAPAQDIIIQAAAPADFCPAQAAEQKIKKQKGEPLTLTLQQTPDVAAAVGKARRPGQTLVIFAAETQRLEENAREKMARKNADLVVANDVTREGAGFGADTNIVTLLDHRGAVELPKMTKRALADAILTRALQKGESV